MLKLVAHLFTTDAIYGLLLPSISLPVFHVVRSSICQLSRELIRGVTQKSAIVSMAILLLTYVPLAVRNVRPYTQNKLYI